MFNQFVAGFHISSRRPKSSFVHHSVQIVISEPVRTGWTDAHVDFAVEAATGIATSCTADENGEIHVESEHIDLPDDLANVFVGTLLL
jgi:hypothetical protein